MISLENNFKVSSFRVYRKYFGWRTFYVPEILLGNVFVSIDCKMPSVWGFDSEQEAWNVCETELSKMLIEESEMFSESLSV